MKSNFTALSNENQRGILSSSMYFAHSISAPLNVKDATGDVMVKNSTDFCRSQEAAAQ